MFSLLQCPSDLPHLPTHQLYLLSLKQTEIMNQKEKKRSAYTATTKQKSLTKITKLQIKTNKQKTIKKKNGRTKQNKTPIA